MFNPEGTVTIRLGGRVRGPRPDHHIQAAVPDAKSITKYELRETLSETLFTVTGNSIYGYRAQFVNTLWERVGYPAQKPLALLEPIVKTSPNEGYNGAGIPSAVPPTPASTPRIWADAGSTSRPRPSSWSTCAGSRPWAICSTTDGDSSHRHPQAHRHRRASALPSEQARPVRPAGRPA